MWDTVLGYVLWLLHVGRGLLKTQENLNVCRKHTSFLTSYITFLSESVCAQKFSACATLLDLW